ncbi:helix-turn-helix domain-containing protein [Sinirhodobacter populi]|uniref:Helix-turn-helix domain-containing protein n=1 Tax=Paenirhodobacter populi TaxID=2306993 RepID=A0A443K8T6_9RHOB|nr:AraC family transcriptional regulator [Sinirhodobacter populi]RWR29201.1 helix-turn-helix domain-containing protein [Sinirhodobacter populi]
MAISQPYFETVTIPPERSLLVFDRQLPEFPFNWHYHPEFELTLTVNSRGMRFVGDHVAQYGDGDLVLIAPNLPHAFQSQSLIGKATAHRAMICWFTQDWAGGLIRAVPELEPVAALLAQARRGIRFGPGTTARLRGRMLRLGQMDALAQVMELQSLLVALAAAPDRHTLATGEVTVSDMPRDRERLQKVLDHLHRHYDQPLRLKPLCDLVHLTESQLQRVFKRSARMSISAYVQQLRLGRACQMLVQTDSAMGRIATDCGFSDAADFARRFRKARGVTPSVYRATFRGR